MNTVDARGQLLLQNSALTSLGVHGAFIAFYLIMKVAVPQTELILTEIEFLEFEEEKIEDVVRPEDAPAAMRVPKSFADLLRMALPQPKPTEPVEAQPQEMETRQLDRMQMPELAKPKLRIDQRELSSQPQIQLKSALVPRRAAARIADMSRSNQPPAAALGVMDAAPRIDLAEVGRIAVPVQQTASIRIDPSARAKTNLADLRTAVPVISRRPRARAPAGIKLVDTGPVRGVRRVPRSSLPIGYQKGGGGISLKAAPLGRRRVANIPKDFARKQAKPVADLIKAAPGKKGSVEIAGPLAQRKVVNYTLPKYPGWARDKGIEAEVVIRFYVSRDGHVRDRLILERTSGYAELDKISMAALKKWLFAALPDERAQEGDQWGIITFRFRLK